MTLDEIAAQLEKCARDEARYRAEIARYLDLIHVNARMVGVLESQKLDAVAAAGNVG